ncbi:uncharacterized protein [Antedon mediterranea]|uniref:uncharacterized protein n=1 Tax=Antedon mediterranea TaxID=105859 RepID=UPI003AF885F9
MYSLPKIVLLPLLLQRNLVAFIVHHAVEISTESLVLLRDCYGNPNNKLIDKWCAFHLKQLQNKICTRMKKDIEYKAIDIVNTTTKNRVFMICQKLKKSNISSINSSDNLKNVSATCTSDSVNNTGISSFPPGTFMQTTSTTNLPHISPETLGLSHNNTMKSASEITSHHADGKQHLSDGLLTVCNQDNKTPSQIYLKRNIGYDTVAFISDLSETVEKKQRGVISEESLVKEQIAAASGNDAVCVQEPNEHLDTDLQIKLEKISRSWLSSQKSCYDLGFLGTLNSAQMSVACRILKLEELYTKHLVTVSQDFAAVSDYLPITSLTMIAQLLFMKKILDLTNPPSRQLVNASLTFSKVFQGPAVQNILIPVIQSDKFAACQCSLVTNIVKDALDVDNKHLFFRDIFKENMLWNVHVTTCVQLLIDSKLQFEDSDITMIVSGLQNHASNMRSCAKFAKLLHTFVKKYGSQLTSDHMRSLRTLLEGNETFLKKAVMSAIDRLNVD